jgi:hypothetical protein
MQLIHTSPSINGNGAVWKELITKSEAKRTVLCKHLGGKVLFTATLRIYAAIHREMRVSLLPEHKESTEEFREQRRRKRNFSEEQAKRPKPTSEMADFSAIKKFLEGNNLAYFSYYAKSEKPIKAVIRQPPQNTPVEDISKHRKSL